MPAAADAAVARQTTCPVTGEKLGSMGQPVPVSVKGETIYVCCQSCVDAVRAEPDKYLTIVRSQRAGPGAATSAPTSATPRGRTMSDDVGHASGVAGHVH